MTEKLREEDKEEKNEEASWAGAVGFGGRRG
jgi:hypothetical protein